MAKKSACFLGVPEDEELRLINILANLCQSDPAEVEWDGSGSADAVSFVSDGGRYTLKIAKEPAQGKSSSVMDFRVRVLVS